MSGHTYRAFGLTICSDIEFSHLANAEGAFDVRVRLASVPEQLPNPTGGGVLYQSSSDLFLLNIPGVARYLVSHGDDICIEPVPGSDIGAIRLFLFGSAFGALLHQRDVLLLHGSAVVTPYGAVIFAGLSGSGKSTLACAFHRRGYPVLSDDVCAIRTGNPSAVIPGNPYLMLWPDTLRELGIDGTALERVRPQIEKCILPLTEGFASEAAAVHAIYVLIPENTDVGVIVPVRGIRKVEILAQNLYRPHFVEQLDRQGLHFKKVADVARRTPIKIVHRLDASFQAAPIADMIERDFSV